jgi:hypothetical protein
MIQTRSISNDVPVQLTKAFSSLGDSLRLGFESLAQAKRERGDVAEGGDMRQVAGLLVESAGLLKRSADEMKLGMDGVKELKASIDGLRDDMRNQGRENAQLLAAAMRDVFSQGPRPAP